MLNLLSQLIKFYLYQHTDNFENVEEESLFFGVIVLEDTS